jgi:hypothetical protein
MPFLLTGLRGRIERERGGALGTRMLVDNPAWAFAVQWRDSDSA